MAVVGCVNGKTKQERRCAYCENVKNSDACERETACGRGMKMTDGIPSNRCACGKLQHVLSGGVLYCPACDRTTRDDNGLASPG